MKVTKRQLKRIIREEYRKVLKEYRDSPEPPTPPQHVSDAYDVPFESLVIEISEYNPDFFAGDIVDVYWDRSNGMMSEEDAEGLYDQITSMDPNEWPLEWIDALEEIYTQYELVEIHQGYAN